MDALTDFKQINAVEVLKIDNAELYYTQKSQGKLVTKGSLFLLYSQQYNWFILKINNFTYGLHKSIPILASRREPEALRAYVLVDVDGYFVIKVTDTFDHEDLERLEYVLKENTQFAYKEGNDSQEGFPVQVGDGTVNLKTVTIDKRRTDPQDTAQWLYEGGKTLKKTMINTAETISIGMNRVGTYIKTNHLKKDDVQISPQTVSKVSFLNSATGMVASMSTLYIKGLMALGTMIAQKIETKFEKMKNDRDIAMLQEKIPKIETVIIEPEDPVSLPYAAVHCAITIWQGMIQALDILREGFTESAGELVVHRYGVAAGELFKAGAGVAGNINLPGKRILKVVN